MNEYGFGLFMLGIFVGINLDFLWNEWIRSHFKDK